MTLTPGPSVTDVWQAIFAGGTFVVAFGASIIGLSQFRDYRTTAREQSRPYVLVDIAVRETLLMLGVRNVGVRPAANIVVRFDPEIHSTVDGWAQTIRAAFDPEKPLPVLAPGRSLQWYLDNGLFAVNSGTVPQDYTVGISYEDLEPRMLWAHRVWPWPRHPERHKESGHHLSLRSFNETSMNQSGLPEIAKSMAIIAQKMPIQPISDKYTSRSFPARKHAAAKSPSELAHNDTKVESTASHG